MNDTPQAATDRNGCPHCPATEQYPKGIHADYCGVKRMESKRSTEESYNEIGEQRASDVCSVCGFKRNEHSPNDASECRSVWETRK